MYQQLRQSRWLLALLTLTGCASVPLNASRDSGLAGLRYDHREARLQLAVPAATVESAALEALNELGYERLELSTAPDGASTINARTPDRRRAVVSIRPAGPRTTITASVGRFGDERLSRKLLERVAARVGALAAPPAADTARPAPQTAQERPGVPDAIMLREQAGAPQFQDGFLP